MSRTRYILIAATPMTLGVLVGDSVRDDLIIIDEAQFLDKLEEKMQPSMEEEAKRLIKELELMKYEEACVELNRGSNSYDKPRNAQITKQRVRSCRLYRRARDNPG